MTDGFDEAEPTHAASATAYPLDDFLAPRGTAPSSTRPTLGRCPIPTASLARSPTPSTPWSRGAQPLQAELGGDVSLVGEPKASSSPEASDGILHSSALLPSLANPWHVAASRHHPWEGGADH